MNINIDIGQMMQMQQEQAMIMQICKEHERCTNCPIKEKGSIQINQSQWSCENASKVQE